MLSKSLHENPELDSFDDVVDVGGIETVNAIEEVRMSPTTREPLLLQKDPIILTKKCCEERDDTPYELYLY
jgi:hypothetical protein